MIGAERIPPAGPLIVAANHHNALVDGVLLLGHFPRRLVSVAKAPLFSNPLIGPFLRLIGALPVHRRQEGGTDPARNTALFEASSATLRSGQAILIFPEGVSQPEPLLMPLRTGAARMLLAAEADAVGPVTLLPVGLMFHEPGTFRTGWAVVSIGEPVPVADCVALAAASPEEAARRLTARLGEAMRGLIALVDDRQTLRLVEHAERLWRQERGGEWDAGARADWRRRATRAYRYLSHHDATRLSRLRGQMERYVKDLDEAGLRTAVLLKAPPPSVALRYAGGAARGPARRAPPGPLGARHPRPAVLAHLGRGAAAPARGRRGGHQLVGGLHVPVGPQQPHRGPGQPVGQRVGGEPPEREREPADQGRELHRRVAQRHARRRRLQQHRGPQARLVQVVHVPLHLAAQQREARGS